MCGIAGMIDLRYDEEIINAMLSTMKRRGPDSNGAYLSERCALLHSRLSVIDLSNGQQPMFLEWGIEQYCIVYNGELYNTFEIRNALIRLGHQFDTQTDTEVVLHAYAQWGHHALDKLNGIFAFAIWEVQKKRLFLSRDRIGVKPLFYKLHDEGFLFASEMKTILQYPTVNAEINETGIMQLAMLAPGRMPGSGVFKDIYELEPGCYGIYEQGKWRWEYYWHLTDAEHKIGFEETAETVRYLVTDAIKRQTVSDVSLGSFLSGGLDSSIISKVCNDVFRNRGEQLQTFSVDYEKNNLYFVADKFQPESDNKYINIMDSYLNSDHYTTTLQTDDLVKALFDAVDARDLPGMADVDSSLLLFCKDVRKHVTVALSGECADEIFGGYPWYRDPAVRSVEGFPWAQNTQFRASLIAPELIDYKKAQDFVKDLYIQTVKNSHILPNQEPVEVRMKEMVNLNHKWFMQTLLDRKDRMSMYSGLEVRVPFCDYRIAEYLYRVPWSFKDYKNREKGLLRYAMKDILPDDVLWRKKSPYPKTLDPQYLHIVSNLFEEMISDNNAPIFQIIDKSALNELHRNEPVWPWYGQLMRKPQTIAYMIMLNYWLTHYHVSIIL